MEEKILSILKKHYSEILSEIDDYFEDTLNVDLTIELTDNESSRKFHCKLG